MRQTLISDYKTREVFLSPPVLFLLPPDLFAVPAAKANAQHAFQQMCNERLCLSKGA